RPTVAQKGAAQWTVPNRRFASCRGSKHARPQIERDSRSRQTSGRRRSRSIRMKSIIVRLFAALVIAQFTTGSLAQTPVPPGTKVERDLVFAKFGQQELALDLYHPEAQTGKVPVVVWIYGGAWLARSKAPQASIASWLASHGYAVAVTDYRL